MASRYPTTRMRRNRTDDFVRRLVRENELTTSDLIYPIFIIEGDSTREPVASMPGIDRLTIDELEREAEYLVDLGIPAIALFPRIDPGLKDPDGSEALNSGGARSTRGVGRQA